MSLRWGAVSVELGEGAVASCLEGEEEAMRWVESVGVGRERKPAVWMLRP